MNKPICKSCGRNNKVVLVSYQDQWKGYECERCYEVVATIYETDEEGKLIKYKPYILNQG